MLDSGFEQRKKQSMKLPMAHCKYRLAEWLASALEHR
jgi:hypothetical protein